MQDAARLFMRTGEASVLTGMSERSIRHLCETGSIKATKLGRVWLLDREAFMRRVGLAQEGEASR